MHAEHRRDVRHHSSQKAVLLSENGTGSLAVITNLSTGGLCLAIVGSPRPCERERIDLKVNQEVFLCDIVNRGKRGLHCRFESPIGEPDLSKLISPLRIVPPRPAIEHAAGQRLPAVRDGIYDNNGQWRAEGHYVAFRPNGYNLSRIYTEGFLTGQNQIGLALNALDATIDVLNPYRGSEERDRWTQGFSDAVRHAEKQRSYHR